MLTHTEDDDFHLFTTFRLDSTIYSDATHTAVCGGRKTKIYLLPYHFDRLKLAAATFKEFQCPQAMSDIGSFEAEVQGAIEYEESTANIDPKEAVVSRGKISWWPSGRLEVTLIPVPPTNPTLLPQSFNDYPVPLWTVILDNEPTETDLYIGIKTSHRTAYDRARKSAGLSPKSTTEVLLYNGNGEVVDGSITTAYFYRDNNWVTPQSGGLEGTTRRFALETELCSKANPAVQVDSLRDGETIWLSNAFRGFFTAVFCAR